MSMSRIEKGQPAKQEIEQLKQEVIGEVRKVNRRKVPWRALMFFVMVLAFAGAGAWVLAASGFVSVPFVSAYAYREPTPTRIVESGEALDAVISSSLGNLLTERLQAGGGELAERSFELVLPESAFTASLRAGLGNDANAVIDPDRAQVAILENEGLEIFLPFRNSETGTALVIVLPLRAQDGVITFDAPNVRLGSLSLPGWASQALIVPPLAQGASAFQNAIAGAATVSDIRFTDGSVTLVGEFQVEIKEIPSFF